jgi:hypothetical protein
MSEHIDKPTHVLFAFVDIKMHDVFIYHEFVMFGGCTFGIIFLKFHGINAINIVAYIILISSTPLVHSHFSFYQLYIGT